MQNREKKHRAEPPKGIVRQFEEKDREFVRSICRRTGLKGGPTSLFFEDETIMSILYADYYMDHEAESCFVAEVDGRVVGYVLGCKDTRKKKRVLLAKIYPRVFVRILWKMFTFQYRKKETYQTLWWVVWRAWREGLRVPLDKYPSHAHFNTEATYRGYGLGERLSKAMRKHWLQHGVKGYHCIIREEEGHSEVSSFLRREMGHKILKVKRNTVWEKITGKKWYAKLLVRDFRQISIGDMDASSRH